jgi:hypothetical protein
MYAFRKAFPPGSSGGKTAAGDHRETTSAVRSAGFRLLTGPTGHTFPIRRVEREKAEVGSNRLYVVRDESNGCRHDRQPVRKRAAADADYRSRPTEWVASLLCHPARTFSSRKKGRAEGWILGWI